MKLNFLLSRAFPIHRYDKKTQIVFAIWVMITIFCVVQSLITHRYNNYLIFENTVRNLFHQTSFYAEYPDFHFDTNHYGPLFGVFFMPFAIFPNGVGFMLWNLLNCLLLWKAIETIPIRNRFNIYLIALPCLASATLSQQFNPMSGAFMIFSFTLLNKKKGLWSTMLIILGTFIKLYGIVGLAFFFFVKDKKRFIIYLFMWSAIFFVLPMLFSSPDFIIGSYKEWFVSLVRKNANNILENSTDISIMGFVRTIFLNHNIPNSMFLLIGITIFGLPYLNVKAYGMKTFQLYILASMLLFPVLFSTGSEDCTYIITIAGVGIWYIFAEKTLFTKAAFVVIFIFSCDFPLLLFPKISSQYPVLLSMLSFPFFIIWLVIICKATFLKKEEQLVISKSELSDLSFS